MMVEFRTRIEETSRLCVEERPGPCSLVIFGASGDLAKRKLIPALYKLYKRGLLPEKFSVVGFARSSMTDGEFRERACEAIGESCEGAPASIERFGASFHYVRGGYDDAAAYDALASRLAELGTGKEKQGCHVFYLATPPRLAPDIVSLLAGAGLVSECGEGEACARVIVEKPFGYDLESAKALDRKLGEFLEESQIYRIDHYVGKETVQNMLVFRFANAIFEPVWNRDFVDHIEITTAESIGVEGRAGYFDEAGALRDVFQNHLLQMMATVAMEPPSEFSADSVRSEKVKLLAAIRHVDPAEPCAGVVRGQYAGYLDEQGVKDDSPTETYVAAELLVDNDRWRGVPFFLRTGKKLARRVSEIAIFSKRIPKSMFAPFMPEGFYPNTLVFNVQPDEGISLSIQAKAPGPKLCMDTLSMDFRYKDVGLDLPDAYERLLLDCMQGDQMLFIRSDALEHAWSIVDPIREAWDSGEGCPLCVYEPGSSGPSCADDLIKKNGRQWREI